MNDNQVQPGQTYVPDGQQVSPSPTPPAAQSVDGMSPVSQPQPEVPVAASNPYSQPEAPLPQSPPPPSPVAPPPPSVSPAPQQEPAPEAPAPVVPAQGEEEGEGPNLPAEPEETLLSWNAPEFTYISKPAGWYGILALICLVLAGGLIYLRQWVAVVMVFVMGVAMAIVGSRRPRNLNYTISNYGVHVGDKAYRYDDFKAYYEGNDYGQKVLELVPTKRFSPLVSMPVLPQNHDEAFSIIGSALPKTEPTNNPIDKLFTFFRF